MLPDEDAHRRTAPPKKETPLFDFMQRTHTPDPDTHRNTELASKPRKELKEEQAEERTLNIERDILSSVKNEKFSPTEMNQHKKLLQNLWEYRYTKYVDNALQTKDWLKVFAFIGTFKAKCVHILEDIVNNNFEDEQIDPVDPRFNMKKPGQIGLFLKDGIIIRVAKVINEKGHYNTKYVKNLHQQFLSYNIVNNLTITMATQMPNFPRVRVPLACLIKYLGFTALCIADPPCQGIQTLINGPTNQLYQSRPEAKYILETIGRNLNLKPYRVLSAKNQVIEIPFSITVELHKIVSVFPEENIIHWIDPESILYPKNQDENRLRQPQYYLLNLCKLWPLFIDSNIIKSTGYLRPEVVLSWNNELSNAVFSKISFQKDEKSQLQLAQACKSVKDENMKALVKMLDEATFFIIDSPSIEDIMHEYGINIRYLGQVAHLFSLPYNRKIFEVEMIARVLKRVFYTTIEGLNENVKDLFTDFLNILFIHGKEGEKFYRDVVYPHVQQYYQYEMSQYPPPFQGGGLLHAICYHFGIKIKTIDYPFFKDIQVIFSASHIVDMVANAKSYDLQTCQLKVLCDKFKIKKKQGQLQSCLTQLYLLSTIAKISSSQRTNGVGSTPQSYFLSEISETYWNMGEYEKSLHYAEQALKGIPQKHADSIKAYCILIRYYSEKKELNRCLEYYDKSIATLTYHLHSNHPLSISVYNTLGFQFLSSDPAKCQKIFAKSFQICEQALGYMHASSGKILLQLANLPLPIEKTINFLLQALTILENIDCDKSKIKTVCMKIAQLYHKIGNLKKVLYYARKSDYWMMEIIALEKLNENKQVLQLCTKITNVDSQKIFLIEKSFSSYLKMLDRTPKGNLYKIFVSLENQFKTEEEALKIIKQQMTTEVTNLTVADFVKNNLNQLIIEIPDLLLRDNFFEGIQELKSKKDQRVQDLLDAYLNLLSIIGKKKIQDAFTEIKKKF